VTVLDIDAIEAQAEVLDEQDLEELSPVRKSNAVAARLVEWFDQQGSDYRFLPASALGERTTRGGGSQPYDLDALRGLAGQIRTRARNAKPEPLEVTAEAKERNRVLGLVFTREVPKRSSAGRPKSTPADEAE
jgi:hypothetical protein